MGRTPTRQRPQALSHPLRAPSRRVYRPRVELLEDRVQPGDTLLGLWATAWGGLPFPTAGLLDGDPSQQGRSAGIVSGMAEAEGLSEPSPQDGATIRSSNRDTIEAARTAEAGHPLTEPNVRSEGVWVGPMAASRLDRWVQMQRY